MQRLLPLVLVLTWIALPATAQESTSAVDTKVSVQRPNAKPPTVLPQADAAARSRRLLAQDTALDGDTLTEAQILRRISRLYRYQADVLAAQAEGDAEHAEGLLELAMAELATLSEQPGVMERPRYRELYRTLITEYERYYGVPDTALVRPHGEIFALRADMFASLNEVEEPLLEDVMLPALEPVATTVPMTTNRLVERSIQFLLRERRSSVERWTGRADTYFPMIEQIFAEEGVPDELKYLAVIESTLNPRARSWAKAVGMWQFMAATGRPYGLDVNSWVDERMDPEKSTRAAARHLKDLYQMYHNDWQVALAGYNCSPRCIKRAMRKSGKQNPTFWDIYEYLPRETRNYVPMFIATALIMSNPEAFDITPQRGPEYAFDLVPVQGMLSLHDVAAMAGTDLTTIQALNPELTRNSLPPSTGPYMLRIPEGSYEQFASAFAELPESKKKPVGEHVVRRGDSLGKISTRYGLSVAALKQANGLRSNTIHPGQRLVVPVASYSSAPVLADATPRTVRYGTRVVRPLAPLGEISPSIAATGSSSPSTPTRTASTRTAEPEAPKPAANKPETTETRIVYRVRRGDSLGKIAQKYGTTVSNIKSWNNLRGTKIYSGQRLVLYSSSTSQPEKIVHRVRSGEHLTMLSKKYGVSISSIKSWNGLSRNTIHPGQRLTIYPGKSAPQFVTHRVQRGESLGKIASRYGTTVSNIKKWNSLSRNTIYPGQRLKIYQ